MTTALSVDYELSKNIHLNVGRNNIFNIPPIRQYTEYTERVKMGSGRL